MGNANGVIQSSDNAHQVFAANVITEFIKSRRNKKINQKKVRYMGGKTFLKFFKEDTWPLVEEIFERLNISESKGYDLFKVFAEIDQNENGKVSMNEIFGYLRFPRSKFTERLFDFSLEETKDTTVFNNFSRKELSFLEFSVRIWNFCTLKTNGLARYVFEIFDIHERFHLTKPYVITMYHLLFNTMPDEIPVINSVVLGVRPDQKQQQNYHTMNNHNIDLLVEILSCYHFMYDESNDTNIITKDQFIEDSCRKTFLIEPVIKFQRHLQKKIGGILYWNSLISYRHSHPVIVAYDFKSNTLQDSIDNIISSVDDFLTAKKRRESQTAEYIMKLKSNKLAKDFEVIDKEVSSREKQLQVDLMKANSNDLLKRMQRKWDVYNHAKESFLHEEFTFDDIWKRREKRLVLYDLLDAAVEASKEYYKWKDKKDIEIMEGTDLDHETRYQDFVENKMIKQHYDPRMNLASPGGEARGDASVDGSLMNPETSAVEQIVMNNGKFIYELLCLVKLYDIVLNDLQSEMENDPKKGNSPAYRERELTIYNNLIHLQSIYSIFQLHQPEDNLVMNDDGKIEGGDSLASASFVLPGQMQSTTTTSSANVKGGESNETLELLLQQNERQKKMLGLIENEQFIEEKKLIKKFQKKTDPLLAEKLAHDELLNELKAKMMSICYKKVRKSQDAREKSFFQEEFSLMQDQGSRITRWEYVLEKVSNKYFYVNIDTLETRHPKTAICEYCDAIIVQHELKCDNCQRYRSPKNKLLYRPLGHKDITLE